MITHVSLPKCENLSLSLDCGRKLEINLQVIIASHIVFLSDSNSARFMVQVILQEMCGALFSTWSKKEDCHHCGGAMESMFLKLPQKLLSSSQPMNRWNRHKTSPYFIDLHYSVILMVSTFSSNLLQANHYICHLLSLNFMLSFDIGL